MNKKIIIIMLGMIIILSNMTSAAFTVKDTAAGTGDVVPFGYLTTYQQSGITWDAGSNYDIAQVEYYIKKQGTPTNNVFVSIYTPDGSGFPNTLLCVSNNSINGASVTTSYAPYNWTFSPGCSLTNGVTYVFKFNVSDTLSGANFYRMDSGAAAGSEVSSYENVGGAGWTQWASDSLGHYKTYTSDYVPAVNNLTITAKDLYTNGTITNFNIWLNGNNFTDGGTGTITTTYTQSNTSLQNIIITKTGQYFNITYTNYNISSSGYNLAVNMFQAEIHPQAFEKITGNQLYGLFNTTNATNETKILITAGNHNITFTNNTYYNITQNFTINPLYNGTINITGVYSSIINITVNNAFSGQQLENFTGNVTQGTYTENFTANGKEAHINLINGNYTFYVEANGYAISETTNYQNYTINNWTHNISFGLYSNNSIRMNIYDETTNDLITQLITIVISGALGDETHNTTNGTFYISNLTDGNYTIKFSGANYTLRTYSVTVADRSTQILNAYLTPSITTAIFTFVDDDTSVTLEDVSISMSRLINGSWTIIESKLSDITGRAQFTYTQNIKYRFTATKTGYINKIFDLDPIIFNSYTVRLTRTTLPVEEQDYTGIGINYYPTRFYEGKTHYFIFTIQSPTGTLQTYGINIKFPGGNVSTSGTNSQGETFNVTVNITGSQIMDKVNLTYWYDTTLSNNRTFFFQYEIIGSEAGNGTIINLGDYDFKLGVMEEVLIAVVVIILVAGLTTMFAGYIAGGGIGLLILGFFTYIGFIPVWAAIISLFVGIMIIIRRAE